MATKRKARARRPMVDAIVGAAIMATANTVRKKLEPILEEAWDAAKPKVRQAARKTAGATRKVAARGGLAAKRGGKKLAGGIKRLSRRLPQGRKAAT